MENELPEGWIEVKIGNYYELVKDKIEPTQDSSYIYIGLEHLAKGGGIVETGDSKDLKSTKTLFKQGDVLYGKLRPYLNKHAFVEFEGICSTDILAFRSNYEVSAKYLNHYLGTNEVLGYASENSQGINLPRVSGSTMIELAIPLPPLAEQTRIVAKLDAAFSHLETLKNCLIRIPELLKKFRQTVLTQAVTGKLTEDWREGNDFPTSKELLNSIEWKMSTYKNKKASLFHTSQESPFDIPDEWDFAALGELAEKLTYGTSEKSLDVGDVAVIRMGNLQNGRINWSDLKYTSNEEDIKKYALKKGDVLFNRTNSPELVGKTSIYESESPAIYAGYLIKIWNFKELNSYYLNYVLNSPYGRGWAWSVKSDGVSQSNINAQKLAEFLIPFPSVKEQEEIVNRVEALFARADAMEAQYERMKAKTDKLPQALLAKAFRGDLVPQDPEDEPAEALLARITEEQDNKETTNKVNNTKRSSKMEKRRSDSNHLSLLEILYEKFPKSEFSFSDLEKQVDKPYPDLKNSLYEILDKGDELTMFFDLEHEVMKFKLNIYENS